MMFIPGWACAKSEAIHGAVMDSSGSAVEGAIVTLESVSSSPRTAITDGGGSFLFSAVEPGDYKITIAANGFATWTAANVAVGSDGQPLLAAVLQVAAASSSINVTLPPHEVAAEQLKLQEKQRLLGVFPDFFVSYAPNPVPLTVAQKFQLGWKTILDPAVFADTGVAAGFQLWRNKYPEFGQGMEGYGKRFGAQYADHATGILVGHVVMQSIFHQDPRYFYKGTGSVRSRALYAIGTAFVRKGDNGHWQPAYSDVLGSMAATEISTLYYPASSRPGRRLIDNALLGFGGRAAHNLLHEFVLRKITPNLPKAAVGFSQRVLREGTLVSLISVEDWSLGGGPITFMLARDVEEEGVIIVPIGTKASSQATFTAEDGRTMHVGLEHMRLKVGDREVPLRSTPLRDGGGQLEHHYLENSGRIAITLYVAETVALTNAFRSP
jgi:Carboxypeptidase regulatory-like domain